MKFVNTTPISQAHASTGVCIIFNMRSMSVLYFIPWNLDFEAHLALCSTVLQRGIHTLLCIHFARVSVVVPAAVILKVLFGLQKFCWGPWAHRTSEFGVQLGSNINYERLHCISLQVIQVPWNEVFDNGPRVPSW